MQNPKSRSASPGPEASAPTNPPQPSEGSIEQANRRYQEGIEAYVRAIGEVQVKASQRWDEAQRDYQKAIQSLQEDIQKRLQEFVTNTSKSVEDALSQPNAQTRYLELQQQYVKALLQRYEEYQMRSEDANRELLTALDQLRKESGSASRDAFRRYVQSLQEAWAQLDFNTLVGAG